MTKLKRIGAIFNILVQYEKIGVDPEVTEETYLRYLERMYVWYVGYGNDEIIIALKGLMKLGLEANHYMVKTTVFHIIEILNGEVA